MVDYTKSTRFKAIKILANHGDIDPMYVRHTASNGDEYFHCDKPSHLKRLETLIEGAGPEVVGWRLHNHKWAQSTYTDAMKSLTELNNNGGSQNIPQQLIAHMHH